MDVGNNAWRLWTEFRKENYIMDMYIFVEKYKDCNLCRE